MELALSRLNISQEDLGSIMVLSQSSVSLIKNGKRKTIPNKLLCYLIKHGFNLNMLFDDNVSVVHVHQFALCKIDRLNLFHATYKRKRPSSLR